MNFARINVQLSRSETEVRRAGIGTRFATCSFSSSFLSRGRSLNSRVLPDASKVALCVLDDGPRRMQEETGDDSSHE